MPRTRHRFRKAIGILNFPTEIIPRLRASLPKHWNDLVPKQSANTWRDAWFCLVFVFFLFLVPTMQGNLCQNIR